MLVVSISRPYQVAQNKSAWRAQTCSTRTQPWVESVLIINIILWGRRKASLGPSLLQHLGSRFSLANGLSRLSTTLGLPDALHRLGLTAPVEVSTAAPQQQADTHTRVAASDAGVAPARAGSVNTRFASSQDAAATAAVDAAVMHEEDVGWQPDEQSSQQYAEHATQHPDQHGGLDQARETRQTAKTHQQSHSHSVVGKTSSLSRPAQQHRSQQEALGEEFVDENQPDEVQTVRQQRRDSVARMPLQAMQASSLHTEGKSADLLSRHFISFGSLDITPRYRAPAVLMVTMFHKLQIQLFCYRWTQMQQLQSAA